MSINEVTGPLSAATKRTASRDRVFGNLPTEPKKTRVAGKATEKGLMRLLNRYPGGEADDDTLSAHSQKIKDYARQLRASGIDVSKYNIPDLD